MPDAANPTPLSARHAVSGLGTRRVRRSIAAAAATPAVSVPITTRSDGLTNASPENRKNRLPERRDAGDRDHRNQTRQQAVLEQVLAVRVARQALDCVLHPLHGPHPSQRGAELPHPCPPQFALCDALTTSP